LLGVPSGAILFDVTRLKKTSTFQISTPLGIAGIRGTSGYARSNPDDAKSPVSFGLASGSADFTTPNGNSRPVGPGESFGVAGQRQGYAMESNPSNAENLLGNAKSFGNRARSEAGPFPFRGAPERSTSDSESALTPAQIQALEQAALESGEALVQTAVLLAIETPGLAPEIAAFASALVPSFAVQVALAISGMYPNLAAAVAAKVAAVLPSLAETIALEIIREIPESAVAVASSVVAVAPESAVSIVRSVASEVPDQASNVAQAVMVVVPEQGDVVRQTVQSVLLLGAGNNQSQLPVNPRVPDNVTENPGVLNPTPTPPPTPTPTPVSPSA
jgi:hypothetical protein